MVHAVFRRFWPADFPIPGDIGRHNPGIFGKPFRRTQIRGGQHFQGFGRCFRRLLRRVVHVHAVQPHFDFGTLWQSVAVA